MNVIRPKNLLLAGLIVFVLVAGSSTASAYRYRRYGWWGPYTYGYSPYNYGYYGYGSWPYHGYYYGPYGPYDYGAEPYGWYGYPFYGGYYSGPYLRYRHRRPFVGRRGFYYGWY